ncbi:hypothetical protein EGR_10702 [Echinococcus granulosus]|uniref:Uncharacterized protein n=1 Tax=Echinococcus granulosus TaxID=6210 RepID=W6ULS7_ECHGR|nr:hypothetical protein EGR_10702 [Echinococcus granulosus]EUB54439.1 hypothetical protein EGR_10702 [Echinococcus granulosus]
MPSMSNDSTTLPPIYLLQSGKESQTAPSFNYLLDLIYIRRCPIPHYAELDHLNLLDISCAKVVTV